MQVVTARIANKKINNGVTKPYIVTCDDGEHYVVKFMQNPEGKRVLANEYVCAKIAEVLELPLTQPSFINVKQRFIDEYGQKVSCHVEEEISSGLHFGTKYIKKAYPITSSEMIKNANNIDCIPDIILFDQLICNKDRECNGGNLLYDHGSKKVIVLDHTHAFDIGPLWDEHNLQHKLGEPFIGFQTNGFVYRKLIPYVKGNNPFDNILSKMQRLNNAIIGDIIYNIPKEWDVTDTQKEKLREYLIDRLNRIEKALPVLKKGLPYWKGGA